MRLRLLVNKAFTPHTVEELTPFIRSFVDEVLDAAQAHGRRDVMADLTFPLPATVIAEMLRIPPQDHTASRSGPTRRPPWSATRGGNDVHETASHDASAPHAFLC
jgi:cytochrome P450